MEKTIELKGAFICDTTNLSKIDTDCLPSKPIEYPEFDFKALYPNRFYSISDIMIMEDYIYNLKMMIKRPQKKKVRKVIQSKLRALNAVRKMLDL